MTEDGKYVIMISSSVYHFEDQLLQIASYLRKLGYEVVLSMDGSIQVHPFRHNFVNCLDAVAGCDMFVGIIRPYAGSGQVNGVCITYEEMKKARELHKPSWFVVSENVMQIREFLHVMRIKQNISRNKIWSFFCDLQKMKVLDLFETSDKQKFDPMCIEMVNFVTQSGVPFEERVNNWCQNFRFVSDITHYLGNQFSDKQFIENILKEA